MTARKTVSRIRSKKRVSAAEAARLNEIRRKVREEFPPSETPKWKPVTTGIRAEIRKARIEQGLTWYAVAKRAQIPHPATVRDIEYGKDVKLSNLEAVAAVLGLKLELVAA